MKDREVGKSVFENAVLNEQHSPDTAKMEIYGLYLANGGSPDKFAELTDDDIQIMHTSFMGLQRNTTVVILKGISKILSSMFGGE